MNIEFVEKHSFMEEKSSKICKKFIKYKNLGFKYSKDGADVTYTGY